VNLLFTSAGRRGYLLRWFREALPVSGAIHALNSKAECSAFTFADFFGVSPEICDPEYVPFLLNYCRHNNIRAIFPLFDEDIPVLAAVEQSFNELGVELFVPPLTVAQMCNDKWHSNSFLKSYGIDTPRTFLTHQEAMRALETGVMSWPMVVKPRVGMGSIGFYFVSNPEELRTLYSRSSDDIARAYLNQKLVNGKGLGVVVQEYLIGQEYGLDVINNLSGDYVATLVKKKLAMRNGETDIAVTVEDRELEELGKKMSKLLRHKGVLDVDVIRTTQGQLCVIDLNARFGGGYPFSHLAGADIPRVLIAWLGGEKINPEWVKVTPGVVGMKDISMVSPRRLI
jgi:carbamoyl-phosphate synthase large subunit